MGLDLGCSYFHLETAFMTKGIAEFKSGSLGLLIGEKLESKAVDY